ncbi:hypothetical protein PDESU_05224 [Pontiella desulfatans]|uniref:Uncharacterized protein n=1 Tax=Pontiella desulfatans TaxID=2750659 RepID=A0A6C2U9U9_PONDE|nr:hypothetical protein [Pontiella desulfatans]VGO16633.1 hypothetical protein PDESU_05224 [Pontiella desulfatans]
MNVQPYSDEAKQQVWEAYDALDEKHKRAFARSVAKHDPVLFKYWARHSHLPGGYTLKRVVYREHSYGKNLDKALQEYDEGELAADVVATFLMKEGLVDSFLSDIPPDLDDQQYAQYIDDRAKESDSVFAELATVFMKCYRPECGKHERADVADSDNEMKYLVERMDNHADALEELASSLRLAKILNKESVIELVDAASEDVERLIELMRQYRESTDIPEVEFKSPDDVHEHVEALCNALNEGKERDQLVRFLSALAKSLRALRVSHRSATERTRLENLRDEAAGEVDEASKAVNPTWAYKAGLQGSEWLRWVFQISDEELDETEQGLRGDGYNRLAEFIGVGDANWIVDKPEDSPEECKQDVLETEEVLAPENESAGTPPDAADSAEEQLPEEAPVSETASPEIEQKLDKTESLASPPKNESSDHHKPDPDPDPEPEPDKSPTKQKVVWPIGSAQDVAVRLAADLGEKKHLKKVIPELVWKLVAEGHIDIACHVTRMAETALGADEIDIHSWAWELLSLAPYVEYQRYEIQDRMQELVLEADVGERLFDNTAHWYRLSLRLLLVACGLRPAIMAPGAGTSEILAQLHFGEYQGLHQLNESVTKFSRLNIMPEPRLINNVLTEEEWKEAFAEVEREIQHWRLAASTFKTNFQPANQMWKEWLKPEGVFGEMLAWFEQNDKAALKKLEQLCSTTNIDELISSTRNKHSQTVVGVAKRQLARHAEEALSLANRWVELKRERFEQESCYGRDHFRKIRDLLSEKKALVEKELGEIKAQNGDAASPNRIAADLVQCVIERTQSCMNGRYKRAMIPSDHTDILDQCLLRFPNYSAGQDEVYFYSLKLDELDSITGLGVLQEMVKVLAEGLPAYHEVFDIHCEKGNLNAAELILDILEGNADEPELIEQLQSRLQAAHVGWEGRYGTELAKVEGRLGDAMAKTLLSSTEFKDWSDKLQLRQKQLKDGTLRSEGLYFQYMNEFHEIDSCIEQGREQGQNEIHKRLEKLSDISPANRDRILSVLDQGDVYLANDYIDRLEAEGALIEAQGITEDDYSSTPAVLHTLEKLAKFERRDSSLCVKAVRSGQTFHSIDFSAMDEGLRAEYADILQFWFDFRIPTRKRGDEKSPETLLRGLGFGECRVVRNASVAPWICVETSEDVSCPVPQLGSEANGRYYVQFSPKKTPENLISSLNFDAAHSDACIVFYLGQYPERDRRKLSHVCREHKKTVIVVDDLLMIAMATGLENKLDTFFKATLPFTYLMPYPASSSSPLSASSWQSSFL